MKKKTFKGWFPLPQSIQRWYEETDSMVNAIIELNPKMCECVAMLLRKEWRLADVKRKPFLDHWVYLLEKNI